MKMRYAFVSAAAVLVAATAAWAQDEREAERIAGGVCVNCHGADGNSTAPLFPRLAGQQAEYLDVQLHAFRDHSRADPHARAFMWGMTQSLSDSTIKGLAAFYAKQTPMPLHHVDSAAAQQGKKIYEQGVDAQGVPACAGCHGPQGEGNGAMPRLAGQHTIYLVKQMEAFRSMLRENDIMHENTKNIDNDQISALAAYLGSD